MLKRWCLIYYSLFVWSAGAQTAEETYQKGWELVLVNQIDSGLSLMNRAGFFKPELWTPEQCQTLGDTLFYAQRFKQASFYYQKVYDQTLRSKVTDPLLYKISASLYFSGKYEESLEYMSRVKDIQQNDYRYYMFLNLYSLTQYDSSLTYLKPLLNDSIYFKKIAHRLHKTQNISPHKAMVMSLFLPGLGQAYAHDYKNAINSLLLNSVLVYSLIRTYKNYSWIEVLLGPLSWWERYYRGGAIHAKDIAEKYKKEQARKLLLEVNGYLMKKLP